MSDLPEGYKDLVLGLTVPGLYCFMVLLGRRLKRQHGVKLGWLYHLFSFCLAIYVPAIALNLQWRVLRHLGAAVVLLGAVFVIALIERFVFELYLKSRHGVAVPRFLTEVSRLAILALALFVVLETAYDQTIKGLLIAPGIAAVVIGLAMQDLLGNIIAGLALQAGKSFVHGDWLVIDNQHAEVVEINWRATQLRTLDDILIEVPNREVARQTIFNLNRPQRRHAVRIPVTLDYSDPPTRVKDVLLHAVANAKGVCAEPKPAVYLKSFGDSGIEYEIKFWMDDHRQFPEITDAVRTNVWYGLKRHGLRIPYPTRTVHVERAPRDKRQELQSAARTILREQPLFKCLQDEQLDALLPRGRVVHFGRGERLIEQGQNGDSMFIMVEGEASVIAERNGVTRQIASLKAGDCFGEMSLLTGEQRIATVVAKADCEVVEITKPVLARTLKEHPELLRQLSELLAARQLETESAFTGTAPNTAMLERQTNYAAGFLEKLRHFFEL